MPLVCINPDYLPTPETYSQVVVATGSKWVFVSGQEPEDMQGKLVGRALAAAGTEPRQVTKITIYIVDHKREYLPIIEEARVSLFGDHKPADVLVGIATLSNPAYLIEVDAIAVIG
jgi:enamine deaminase RidA (YjgF/YER057c/UK114 family)